MNIHLVYNVQWRNAVLKTYIFLHRIINFSVTFFSRSILAMESNPWRDYRYVKTCSVSRFTVVRLNFNNGNFNCPASNFSFCTIYCTLNCRFNRVTWHYKMYILLDFCFERISFSTWNSYQVILFPYLFELYLLNALIKYLSNKL